MGYAEKKNPVNVEFYTQQKSSYKTGVKIQCFQINKTKKAYYQHPLTK